MRDIETIDSRAAVGGGSSLGERGGPLPSIAVADALLDERCESITPFRGIVAPA